MKNFFYSIPTKVAFGRGEIKNLPTYIKEFGTKVLLVYGGGSIKRNGIYDTVINLLVENNILYEELSGVDPNPKLSTVRKGIDICKEKQIEVLLPIGGGSSIDCAKAIAAGYYYEGEPWDLVENNQLIKDALPIISIPTISATGSEMDPYSVITNVDSKQKMDLSSEKLYPKYSILDPEYTYSVPSYQTAVGTVDIMSHILEVYFNGERETYMQDRIMESLLRTCVKFGPIACEDPENYEARANLMWASQWAINGFISCGKPGPWPAHSIEHQLSAYYDVTHGHGLAIITPVLMKYILSEQSIDRFISYGIEVFDIDKNKEPMDIAIEAIEKTKELFIKMGLTMTLREIGITDESNFEAMAKKAAAEGLENCIVPLYFEDVMNIYKECL